MSPTVAGPASGTRNKGKRAAVPGPNPTPRKRSKRAPAQDTTNTDTPHDVTDESTNQPDRLGQLIQAVGGLTDSMNVMREDIEALKKTSQPNAQDTERDQHPDQSLHAPADGRPDISRRHTASPSPPPSITDASGKNIPPSVKRLYPHLEASVLLSVVSGTLEVKDLPKLIPYREKPKGRQNAADSGASYHFETGKVIHESPQSTFEKDVPTIFHLLNIMLVYAGPLEPIRYRRHGFWPCHQCLHTHTRHLAQR